MTVDELKELILFELLSTTVVDLNKWSYICFDGDGEIYGFSHKPYIHGSGEVWFFLLRSETDSNKVSEILGVMPKKLHKCWKESLFDLKE